VRGGGKSDWVVVTNDRELARRCSAAGASVERAWELVERIERGREARAGAAQRGEGSPGDKPGANAEELEHWRKVFGDKE